MSKQDVGTHIIEDFTELDEDNKDDDDDWWRWYEHLDLTKYVISYK